MDEQPQNRIGDDLSDQLGNEQEMVIMYPDKVTRAVDFSYATGKSGICSLVEGVVGVGRSIFGSNVLPE